MRSIASFSVRQPVLVNARMVNRKEIRMNHGDSSAELQKTILVRSENLQHLSPSGSAKALVCNFDAMLPRQRMRLTHAGDGYKGALFQHLCAIISDWRDEARKLVVPR